MKQITIHYAPEETQYDQLGNTGARGSISNSAHQAEKYNFARCALYN